MGKSCVKKGCEIVTIALIGTAFQTGANAAEKLGSASCYRTTPGGACAAVWDFSSVPRSFFFVEKFEYENEKTSWQRVEGPASNAKGVSVKNVDGGYLYRVVGCADKTGTVNCAGSTAFWAPSRPANLDDIPDEIRGPTGYYLRDRGHSRELQILDYNVALISKLIDTVDMSAMPPMTNLPFSDLLSLPPEILQEDAELDYNVHAIYPMH